MPCPKLTFVLLGLVKLVEGTRASRRILCSNTLCEEGSCSQHESLWPCIYPAHIAYARRCPKRNLIHSLFSNKQLHCSPQSVGVIEQRNSYVNPELQLPRDLQVLHRSDIPWGMLLLASVSLVLRQSPRRMLAPSRSAATAQVERDCSRLPNCAVPYNKQSNDMRASLSSMGSKTSIVAAVPACYVQPAAHKGRRDDSTTMSLVCSLVQLWLLLGPVRFRRQRTSSKRRTQTLPSRTAAMKRFLKMRACVVSIFRCQRLYIWSGSRRLLEKENTFCWRSPLPWSVIAALQYQTRKQAPKCACMRMLDLPACCHGMFQQKRDVASFYTCRLQR